MKLSDKALGKIGLELLGHAAGTPPQGEPAPARQKHNILVRGMRPGAAGRARKATVLTFRKRHR
jgi:hypothetical protein